MRERILRALQAGGHISGEELGQRLNISRTAVWKHINDLRKNGYQISSSTRSGYLLVKNTHLLVPQEIKQGLDTQIMGKRIEHYSEVSSTQDIAVDLARNNAPEGTLIVAEMQTQGRGRRGRCWFSVPEGGIYLSLILRPDINPSRVFQIPLIAGVALAKAIKKVTSTEVKIKWPNDIIIGVKKAGGILTEMSSEMERVNFVLLGVGINVNIPVLLLAGPAAGMATSLSEECGQEVSRVKLVQIFLTEFENLYNEFLIFRFGHILDQWKALNNTLGSWVRINDGREEFDGKALDIDDEGFLLVRTESGNMRKIICGDIFVYDPND